MKSGRIKSTNQRYERIITYFAIVYEEVVSSIQVFQLSLFIIESSLYYIHHVQDINLGNNEKSEYILLT